MTADDIQSIIQLTATVVGISGGLLGLVQFFSDKREKELREWQKVVIYKIFRQNETKALGFIEILEKYRGEAQAVADIDLKKKEISEDALRRILMELASSSILGMEPSDSFKLNVNVPKYDPVEIMKRLNDELVRLVAPNPFFYTVDNLLKEFSPQIGVAIPILRTEINRSIQAGVLQVDDQGRIAFPR